MATKPYKPKSLKSAQSMVRRLVKQIDERNEVLKRFDYERKMLAKLAAKTPQFYNPLVAMEAEQIRDRILGM